GALGTDPPSPPALPRGGSVLFDVGDRMGFAAPSGSVAGQHSALTWGSRSSPSTRSIAAAATPTATPPRGDLATGVSGSSVTAAERGSIERHDRLLAGVPCGRRAFLVGAAAALVASPARAAPLYDDHLLNPCYDATLPERLATHEIVRAAWE